MLRTISFIFLLHMVIPAHAQVVRSVVLDSVVVQAVKRGFDVSDFIEMVKSDTSFRRGFRNLRNSPHEVVGNMMVFGKKQQPVASRNRTAIQHVYQGRRWIEITSETATGKFYDRKEEPKTYTAELFDEIFFYTDTLPVTPYSSPITLPRSQDGGSHVDKLKTLVFQPGVPVDGVPVVGKRLAIFDDDMTQYYDYSITARVFADSVSCYVFECIAKPEAGDYPVLRSLRTWFDRRTFQIVYRDYSYRYYGLLFDFDVKMKVTMDYSGENLYPKRIEYAGFWDLPARRKETTEFELDFEIR